MDSPIKSGYDENEGGDQMRLGTYSYVYSSPSHARRGAHAAQFASPRLIAVDVGREYDDPAVRLLAPQS